MPTDFTKIFLEYENRLLPLHVWEDEYGVEASVILERLANGESIEYSIKTPKHCPVKNVRMLTLNGVTKSVKQWCDETGLTKSTINRRLRLGWPVSRVLSTEKYIRDPEIS